MVVLISGPSYTKTNSMSCNPLPSLKSCTLSQTIGSFFALWNLFLSNTGVCLVTFLVHKEIKKLSNILAGQCPSDSWTYTQIYTPTGT